MEIDRRGKESDFVLPNFTNLYCLPNYRHYFTFVTNLFDVVLSLELVPALERASDLALSHSNEREELSRIRDEGPDMVLLPPRA